MFQCKIVKRHNGDCLSRSLAVGFLSMNNGKPTSYILSPERSPLSFLAIRALNLALLLWVTPTGVLATEDADEKVKEYFRTATEFLHEGDLERSISAWTEAVKICRTYDYSSRLGTALLGRAEAFQVIGRHARAIADLEELLEQYRDSGDVSKTAIVLGSLGKAYYLAGEFEISQSYLEESADRAREGDLVEVASRSLNDLGNVHSSRGDYKQALAAYQKALQAAELGADPLSAITARINVARALEKLKRNRESENNLYAALDAIEKLTDQGQRASFASLAIAKQLLRLESKAPSSSGVLGRAAYGALNSALQTAQSVGDRRTTSYALGYMAQLYESRGQFEDSLSLTRRAIFQAQQVNAPELLYRWEWQLARLLRQQGQIDLATANYKKAIQTLQLVRQDLALDYRGDGYSFRDVVGDLFLELADLLLEGTEGESSENRTERLLEARNTIEMFKAAELEDYFKDECVSAYKAKRTSLDDIATDTAIIYPLVLKDRTELLVTLPSGLKRLTIEIPSDELSGEVTEFRRRLEVRITHDYLPHAKRLYETLIRPIEDWLAAESIKTLVFVPDGPLRRIPLGALYDGEQFLIERYAIAITPGLELTDPTPFKRTDVRVLLGGISQSVQGFPALPFVTEELTTVQAKFGGTLLLDEDFEIAKIEDELSRTPYSVLHIASHAVFDFEKRNSFLLTYEDRFTMDALEQVLKFSQFRELPIELLVLSACQTAAGDDRAALGLAGVGIKAGARAVIASLWAVSDKATTDLFSNFYGALQATELSKAKALRQAQLSLIEDRRYRHPGYWSPFILIGNWL